MGWRLFAGGMSMEMDVGSYLITLSHLPDNPPELSWGAHITRNLEGWSVDLQATRLEAETTAMQMLHKLVKAEAEAVEAWNRDIIARRYAQAGHDPAELGYTSSDLLPIPKGS